MFFPLVIVIGIKENSLGNQGITLILDLFQIAFL